MLVVVQKQILQGAAAAAEEVPNDATRKRRRVLVDDNNQGASRRRVSRRTLVLVNGYPHHAGQVIPFVPPGLLAESTILHGRVVRCTLTRVQSLPAGA